MYEVAIIGAGPAGASAALFTAKAGKKTIVLDSDKGMTKRAWFENFYGVSEISGPDLIETGIKQFQKFGAEYKEDTVISIEKRDSSVVLTTVNGDSIEAKHLIIASGIHTDLAEQLSIATKVGTEPRIKTIFDVNAQGKTNVEGIWAAGTCTGVSVHAIITAGDGAKVAINVISELNGERYVDHDMMKA
ncbi:FAD-dependent oxidoreductase [Paenibacillus endoradicis]|uniref:FAD-dependent oxidoreductase n=1 Tax=Paenibacillus endoradicis TaxID=2972487 RepID=UPI0021595402|nr:FAD-dependent oxidoreductase [Paenibacillus endoradicis]MCR8657732.1 FAD-dependent oxidoreductase [Paenibacillus endoradicis]